MLTTFAIAATMLTGVQDTVSLSLYGGQPLAQAGISIAPWGGGAIEESSANSISGSNSLLVRTATYFQGGTIKFAQPVNLAPHFANRENMLQVSVFVMRTAAATSGGGGGGGLTGGGGGLMGGGGMTAGGGSGTTQPTTSIKNMETLRVVIRTTDGKAAEGYYPLATAAGSVERWRRVGIPLVAIPGFADTNKEVASISVSGDAPASFYLGEVRVVTDQTPIQGTLSHRELNLGRGQEVTLWATAEAGFSILEYAWDFDDKDGLQDESRSQVLVHRFRVPGEYTVTCTIRDKYGFKQPWQGTIRVTVNP
ncbi:MAG: PKD domain-containing protein [Fimbriimonadales bacterium]|nr:PKD domain-containing protein [Fimbriimonadales bacterium]